MAQAVWEELQATEAKAEQIIVAAKSAGAVALKEARQAAAELIRQAEEQARAVGELLLNDATNRAETAKQAHLATVDEQVQKLTEVANGRLPGVVNLIVEKVVS